MEHIEILAPYKDIKSKDENGQKDLVEKLMLCAKYAQGVDLACRIAATDLSRGVGRGKKEINRTNRFIVGKFNDALKFARSELENEEKKAEKAEKEKRKKEQREYEYLASEYDMVLEQRSDYDVEDVSERLYNELKDKAYAVWVIMKERFQSMRLPIFEKQWPDWSVYIKNEKTGIVRTPTYGEILKKRDDAEDLTFDQYQELKKRAYATPGASFFSTVCDRDWPEYDKWHLNREKRAERKKKYEDGCDADDVKAKNDDPECTGLLHLSFERAEEEKEKEDLIRRLTAAQKNLEMAYVETQLTGKDYLTPEMKEEFNTLVHEFMEKFVKPGSQKSEEDFLESKKKKYEDGCAALFGDPNAKDELKKDALIERFETMQTKFLEMMLRGENVTPEQKKEFNSIVREVVNYGQSNSQTSDNEPKRSE